VGFCDSLLPTDFRAARSRDQDLDLALEGAFSLLRSCDVEDVFQLEVHLVHPIHGRCLQSVQKHNRCSHVLASPGEGRTLHPLVVDGGSNVPSPSPGGGEVNHYGPLCLQCGLAMM
jgi:hypothetical protein